MTWLNLSEVRPAEDPGSHASATESVVVWVRMADGRPPIAVYARLPCGRIFRLPPLLAVTSSLPERRSNNAYDVQRGAVHPCAQSFGKVPNIPKHLESSCAFGGLVQKSNCRDSIEIAAEDSDGNWHFLPTVQNAPKTGQDRSFGRTFVRKLRQCLCKWINTLRLKAAMFTTPQPTKGLSYYPINNPERVGHLVGNLDVFLSEREIGLHPIAKNLGFYCNVEQGVENHGTINVRSIVANKAFFSLLQRKYEIRWLGTHAVTVSNRAWAKALISARVHGHRDIFGAQDQTPPPIELPPDVTKAGDKILNQAGINPSSSIVLIHARESSFVSRKYADFAGIDEKRYGYRNVSITAYNEALCYLAANNYTPLRIGLCDQTRAAQSENLRHASELCQEDWFDLYLFHKAALYVGDTSGAYSLADLFRKPIVFTNFAPLGHVYSWSARHLTIFKALHDNYTNKVIPASILLGSEIGWTIHMDKIDQRRYTYRDNTPSEIAAATQEMVKRISGTWTDTPEDIERQRKFWDRIPRGILHEVKRARIGCEFLRENIWLNQ
jgi:putative glycosyltransferase (TIGR04372 family)